MKNLLSLFLLICVCCRVFCAEKTELLLPPPPVEGRCLAEYWFSGQTTLRAERYEVADAAFDAEWRLDGAVVGHGGVLTLLRRSDAPPLELAERGAALRRLSIPEPCSEEERPRKLDLALEFLTPDVISDDYDFDFGWRISGRPAVDLALVLEIVPSRENPSFVHENRKLFLHGIAPKDLHTPGGSVPGGRQLARETLKKEFALTFNLKAPGVTLETRKIRFVPAAQFEAIGRGGDGHFYDRDGTRVVAVLHRKNVNESRSFELPKLLGHFSLGCRGILVVGEDFGSSPERFSELLELGAARAGNTLLFRRWDELDDPESLVRLSYMVRHAACEEVVLLLPPKSRRTPGIPEADYARTIELLAQCAWSNPGVKKVVIASPLPEADGSRSVSLCRILRNALRAGDSEFFEFERYFRATHGYDSNWYRPSDGELDDMPWHAARGAADVLLKHCF